MMLMALVLLEMDPPHSCWKWCFSTAV